MFATLTSTLGIDNSEFVGNSGTIAYFEGKDSPDASLNVTISNSKIHGNYGKNDSIIIVTETSEIKIINSTFVIRFKPKLILVCDEDVSIIAFCLVILFS